MHTTADDVAEAAESLLNGSRALVAVAARSLANADDVTLPQYRALVVLTRSAAVTVGDLAQALDIHPSTATRLCDRLAHKRLIRRQPGAARDRRETPVSLTAAGRRLVERVIDRRRRDLAAIAASMAPAERDHAIIGLNALARAAGELSDVDPFGWADSGRETVDGARGD